MKVEEEIDKLKKQKIQKQPGGFERKEELGSGSATPPLQSAETEVVDPLDLLDEE